MNATELAKILEGKGHKNAYAKINFLIKGAVGMMPKESEQFFDDLIEAIKQTSKDEVSNITAQKKEYMKNQSK